MNFYTCRASFFLLIWTLVNVVSINAQSTLDHLLATAHENNLYLKILETEYHAALEKAPQVSQLPDLEVGIGGFPLPVQTRSGPQLLGGSVTQMFPWFGTLAAKKELENTKAAALYERIAMHTLELEYEIKQAYFQWYEIEQTKRILDRNIELLETLEHLALAKIASGKAMAADALRIQLKRIELKQELQILELSKVKYKSKLKQLLNQENDIVWNPSDSLHFAIIPYTKPAALAAINAQHPSIRMLEWQQAVAIQAIKVNQLDSKPSFGIGLDYMLVDGGIHAGHTSEGTDILQIRVMARIPLSQQKYEAKKREENLRINALENRKADFLNQFQARIEQTFAEYEVARLQVELHEQQIELNAASIRILQSSYSTNGKDFDELLQLEDERIAYDLKLLKAIVNSHLAHSNIERYFQKI